MSKAFQDKRFRFYPCGYKARDMDTFVYVKYKSSKEQNYDGKHSIVDTSADYVHFDLPDRELLFTRQARVIDGDRPFNKPKGQGNWHSGIAFSVASSVGDDLPFDRFMINPHAFTPNTEPRLRDPNSNVTTDKVVISDSGGFQMGHGSVNFIHPGELAEFYNRNADEGMVLDIPARALGDHEILKHTARVQNLNTKYMMKHLKKGFRIGQVVHGLSLDRVDKFRARTEPTGDFPILSISGSLKFNLLEGIHRILHIIMSGKRYEQYHILGVSNPPFFAVAIRMAYILKKKGINVLITADSSSPIAFSLKHTFYSQRVFHEGLFPTRFGIKMSSNADAPAGEVLNVHRRISSNDPLTQVLGGYQDIISAYSSTITQLHLIYANQVEVCRYVNQMCDYADVLDHKTYKALVKEQYARSSHAHIMGAALDYLEDFYEHDLKHAYNKYKFYMPQFSGEKGMHKFPAMEDNETMVEEKENFSVTRKRLIRVIKGYIDFHKTGKVPDSVVKRVPDKKKVSSLKIRL
jgi:hypothetical protein